VLRTARLAEAELSLSRLASVPLRCVLMPVVDRAPCVLASERLRDAKQEVRRAPDSGELRAVCRHRRDARTYPGECSADGVLFGDPAIPVDADDAH